MAVMKTTIDLPDDLLRTVKIRAVQENKKLKDLVAELLRRGLADQPSTPCSPFRVQLPLVECSPVDRAAGDLTPERVAGILVDQEVDAARDAAGAATRKSGS